MRIKKFTLAVLCMFLGANVIAQVNTFTYDLSGVGFMGTAGANYTQWHYFSFEEGKVIGTSDAVIENVTGSNVGTEAIDADWKARTDWDIAFHATDIRTNSGLSGDGDAGCVKIADATINTSLSDVFDDLTEAPANGYTADETLTGTFIFGMTSMPPLRTTTLSLCSATNGWAVVGMSGNTENPTVVVFRTATGKYAKVHLKKFFGDGSENSPAVGHFVMDYVYQSDGSRSFGTPQTIASTNADKFSVYPNPVSEVLNIDLRDMEGNAVITIYGYTGIIVKQLNVKAGQIETLSVTDMAKGTYIVKVNTDKESYTNKIVVK